MSRLEPERPVADVVEFGPGQARLEGDGPVDLVGRQRGQCRARQAGGDVGGVVGIEPGRVQQLPGDLLRSGATGHHAGAGAGEGGHRALPVALGAVDLTEVVRHHDVEEVGVDDLGEHDHVEVGVADAQHVVGSVQCDVDLLRHQRRGLRRTRQARHELDVGPPIGEEPLRDHDLRVHLRERRRGTHPNQVHLRRADDHRLGGGVGGGGRLGVVICRCRVVSSGRRCRGRIVVVGCRGGSRGRVVGRGRSRGRIVGGRCR